MEEVQAKLHDISEHFRNNMKSSIPCDDVTAEITQEEEIYKGYEIEIAEGIEDEPCMFELEDYDLPKDDAICDHVEEKIAVSNHILAPAFHSIELLGVDTVSALRVVIALLAPPFHSKELLRVDAVNALRMATALPMPTFLSRELLVQIAIGA
ncbi:hypothetical protein Q3G72_024859 [Acer saccharum]|nr:hypothetical protein Q3G72_024859 [Acer saccharum]